MTDTMYEETKRKILQAEIHTMIESDNEHLERARLKEIYGSENVWDTSELNQDFEILGFSAPFCVVRRRANEVKGSVEFQHRPRFYFNFKPDQTGR